MGGGGRGKSGGGGVGGCDFITVCFSHPQRSMAEGWGISHHHMYVLHKVT